MNRSAIIAICVFVSVICSIIVVQIFSIGEGEPKESLLDFTCQELDDSISRDGPSGRYVTDFLSISGNWVDRALIREAQLQKGCVEFVGEDKFNYKVKVK